MQIYLASSHSHIVTDNEMFSYMNNRVFVGEVPPDGLLGDSLASLIYSYKYVWGKEGGDIP